METRLDNLHRALHPRAVAVVGARRADDYSWLRNMSTFEGPVYSVNIDENEIPGIEALGITNYKSLLEIPEPVDFVVVAVPRRAAPFVLQDAISKGVAGAAMFTAGFAETAEAEGIDRAQCRRWDLHILEAKLVFDAIGERWVCFREV